MKASLVLVLGLMFPFASFATTSVSDSKSPRIEGEELCKDEAKKELEDYSTNDGLTPNWDSLRLVEADRTWYSPSHYAWYEVEASKDGHEFTLRTLQQYSRVSGLCY